MDGDQGVQTREEMPAHFVEWADAQATKGGKVQCIVWFNSQPNEFYLDYYDEAGVLVESLTFNRK